MYDTTAAKLGCFVCIGLGIWWISGFFTGAPQMGVVGLLFLMVGVSGFFLFFPSVWAQLVHESAPADSSENGLPAVAFRVPKRAALPERYIPWPKEPAEIGGEPALIIPRRPRARSQAIALTLFAYVACAGLAIAAINHSPGWVVACAILVAVFLVVPALYVAGRWQDGGVWLTPTRLIHRSRVEVGSVFWDNVLAVADGEVRVNRAEQSRVRPVWYRLRLRDRVFYLDSRELAVDETVVLRLIETYDSDRTLRSELGTPKSVRRLRALIEQYQTLSEPVPPSPQDL
ncbi:MAG: hypothetical protein ACRDPH_04040 [Marmoricola sp.]